MDKKAALIYIYKILCEQTDNSHSLTQEEIAKILKEKYGLELERKAISRNLKLINEAGFEVGGINSRKGSYLFRDFMNSELIFLNECVRSNPSLTKKYAKDLIEKISRLSSDGFEDNDPIADTSIHRFYHPNRQFFDNIEGIDYAIRNKKQVTFTYNEIELDKAPEKKIGKSDSPYRLKKRNEKTCSPYRLTMKEGVLYLVAGCLLTPGRRKAKYNLALHTFKVDLITGLKVLEEDVFSLESCKLLRSGKTLDKTIFEHPYMDSAVYQDVEKFRFLCPKNRLGAALELFGARIQIEQIPYISDTAVDLPSWRINDLNEKMVRITTNASEYTAMMFALTCGPYIVIEEPVEWRKRFIGHLESMISLQNTIPGLLDNMSLNSKGGTV